MKRNHIAILTVACALAACMALTGCGSSSSASSNSASAEASATASAEAEASPSSAEAQASEGAAQEAVEAEAEEISASGKTDEYEVSIDDAAIGQDYEGKPAIIVTYSWKNNSDKKTSFMAAFYPKCYQDGVQLETAIVMDGIDSNSYMADVKPGAGNTVQLAYALDGTADVEVEVEELFSFKDEVIAARTFPVA